MSLFCRLCVLPGGGFDGLLCIKGGGDRGRASLDAWEGCCGPGALRFLSASPTAPNPCQLAYNESRFLFILDEPDGVPGLFEPPLPACDAGGCQW